MAITLTTTARTLKEARRLQARVQFAAQTYVTVYRATGALLLAGLFDTIWPLPNGLRGLFMAAWVGTIAYEAFGKRLRRRHGKPQPDANPDALWEAQVARAIEEQRPELDNALIHAVQFGANATNDPLVAALIQRELERAERESANLSVDKIVAREEMERARKRFLVVAAVVLFTALLFPRVYRFEIPRLFLFWQDNPPFTLTDFTITPGDARVRSGENLALTIKVSGAALPDRLELVTGRDGEKTQSAPLAAGQNGEYTAQLANLGRDTWYYVAGNTGRSRRYHVEVDNAPRLRALTVTYRPPAYTKKAPETAELAPDGELHGLSGTQAQLDIEADQPLAASELLLAREDMAPLKVTVTPKPGAPNRATATFPIERDGMYRLTLAGAGPARGLKTPDAAQGKVVLLHDEQPLVTFLVPGQNVIAKPGMTVPIVLEAVDDVALQRIEFHRIYNKGKDTAETLTLTSKPREFRHIGKFDLKALGAKPGDVFEYYATAYDNDPQGVHNTDSDRYWIWIVSEEDYRKVLAQQRGPQEMLSQYRAQTDALRSLAEQQAELAKEMAANAQAAKQATQSGDKNAQQKVQQATQNLRQRQRDLQAQAREAARQMRELANQPAQFDIEKGLQKKLSQMADAVENAQRPMQNAANAPAPGQMPAPAQQAAKQLQDAMKRTGQPVEKSLQTLEKTLALYHDLARLQALAKEQAQVAQQAAQVQEALKNGKSDEFTRSRLKTLSEQQAQLRETLAQIQQDLKDHAQQAQADAPEAAQAANQIAEALEKMNTGQTMQQASHAMGTQDAEQGASQAEQAKKDLESLLSQCKQGQGQCQGACNAQGKGQLGQGAGNSLAQMSQRMGMGMPGQQSGQGQNQGQGQSSGQNGQGQQGGGYSAPNPGSRPGDRNSDGSNPQQSAMAMALTQQQSGGGVKQDKKNKPGGEHIGAIAPDALEKPTGDKPKALPKGVDRAASRYPAEYRRLVQDYFKSVSGGK
jgi:hypothetical protein